MKLEDLKNRCSDARAEWDTIGYQGRPVAILLEITDIQKLIDVAEAAQFLANQVTAATEVKCPTHENRYLRYNTEAVFDALAALESE